MGHLPKKGTRLTAQQRPLTDRPAPSIRRRGMVALLVLGLLLWAATAQAQPQDVTHPGPVTNIALTSGYQSITVTWGPPDDNGGSPIVEYVLECRGDFDGVTWNGTTVGGNIHSHKFTQCNLPLQNGTTYDFRMYARNKWRSGSQTDLTIHSTVAGLPAAPTGLTATAGDRQVALSWTAGSNNGSALTAYQYRQNGGSWADIQNSDATTTSHTVTGLTNGTEYTFTVRAVNGQGGGAESTAAMATPATTPAAPTGLTARPDSQTAGQVALSWTAPSDTGGSAIREWEYQQKEDGGRYGNWTDIANSDATTTSHTVTGLENGTAYTFKVRAVNGKGPGAESTDATATTTTTPAAPTGLSATDDNQASGKVALSWTAGGNGGLAITKWKYRQNGGNWTDIANSDATTMSYIVTGLTNGQEYTFKVRAVNNAGAGAASDEAKATPSTTPAKPTLTVVTGNQQVRLSWTAPTDTGGANITGYDYSKDNGSSWSATNATTTTYTVTSLTNGTTYTFQVRAVNKKGEGAESDEVTATPRNFTATAGNQAVTLNWSAPPGTPAMTGWQYRSGSSGSWTAIPNSDASTTSYTVTGLDNGTAYTFQLQALNGSSVVEWVEFPSATPQAPAPQNPTGGGGGGDSGSGGSGGTTPRRSCRACSRVRPTGLLWPALVSSGAGALPTRPGWALPKSSYSSTTAAMP